MIRSPLEWGEALARHTAVAKLSSLENAVQITHGRYFWPLEPYHPGNDVDIEFIAHVLCGDRRWAGVTRDKHGNPSAYSVAQHLVHVADIVNLNRRVLVPGWDWRNSPAPTFHGLMHDSQEAYLRDFVRPLKGALPAYGGFEGALQNRIYADFAVPMNMGIREAVRRVDNMMIFLERDELVGQPCVPYINEQDHPRITIHDVVPDFHVWDAKTAQRRFLERFEEVVASSGNAVPSEYAAGGFRL